ncbi:hypothetical protein [Amycolatopsis magusensis]|uniref:hypothetical protein n=1 Tax=Amycolatopsis magusensis TaxID=882444 RepID=UPI00379CEC1B
MCRSTADGGRRCSGSSRHHDRALNTARKQVERARHATKAARAAGDADALAAAEQRLTEAKARLADTHAAHPHTPTAAQRQGRDTQETTVDAPTPESSFTPDDTTESRASHDRPHTAGPRFDDSSTGQDRDATGGPRVSTHEMPDGTTVTNVNYAAPGATVGEQIGAIHAPGGLHFSWNGFDDDPPAPRKSRTSRTTSRSSSERHETYDSDGRRTVHTHNEASGNDYVPFQIGHISGGTHHH